MPTTIKLGDTGDDVKRLQRVFARMKVLAPDELDGIFGPRTEEAVKDFQESNGLVVDGVVVAGLVRRLGNRRPVGPCLPASSV
jgi:peptidoglycan hydrolase-like protein with peptidoglycan-binding domain